MDFFTAALNALPEAAASPFALIAYAVLVVAWVLVAFRLQRNAQLLKNIDKFPEADRIKAINNEMGGAFIKEGMAAEDWLRSKRQTYIFWGFLAVLGVLVVLATLTIQEAQAKSSRDELVSILTDRSENVVELIDSLLAPQEQYETFS